MRAFFFVALLYLHPEVILGLHTNVCKGQYTFTVKRHKQTLERRQILGIPLCSAKEWTLLSPKKNKQELDHTFPTPPPSVCAVALFFSCSRASLHATMFHFRRYHWQQGNTDTSYVKLSCSAIPKVVRCTVRYRQ